ncbi:MAG: Ig-like domain-containing protein [Actinomycetota bacterium]|nr:Ig-like domain-containing protein [Actinomycetota bacterium]
MTQRSSRIGSFRPGAAGLAALALLLGAAGCAESKTGAFGTAPTSQALETTTTTAARVPDAVVSIDPPLGSDQFAPMTPVTVTAGNGTLSDVVVSDSDGVDLSGAMSADGMLWQATELLEYDTTYSVVATAVNPSGKATTASGSITTVRPRTFTEASITPFGDMTTVGVGMPIIVQFDEDIEDRAAVESRLTVTTTPPVVGSWYWFSDREVHYRPQEYWVPGTHVVFDVGIYGVNVGDNIYGAENRHMEFDIDDAMVAKVDNSDLRMRVYRNGVLQREMPVSMGKPGTLTPSGTMVVMQQHRYYTMDSSTYGVPIDDPDGYRLEVEYASRITYSGIFVHAAPWSVGDQGSRNVSHGCINVSTANAQYFYENFGWGDIVQVTGTGRGLEPTNGFGDWNIPWEQWLLGSALS